MTRIQVNLKRFDIPKRFGGICPSDDPVRWIDETMRAVAEESKRTAGRVAYRFFLPESLVPTAVAALHRAGGDPPVDVGSQGVHWEDVTPGGNFGAFTTSIPAAAVKAYGCAAALVGHSEERLKLTAFLERFAGEETVSKRGDITRTVNETVAESAKRASAAALEVTFCVGETVEERGGEPVDFARIGEVLRAQIEPLVDLDPGNSLTIAYEPRWAIGPGKTPPGPDYIETVSEQIRAIATELFGRAVPVLYGGGLKRENAAGIGALPSVSGGLIALTKFTDPIGFNVSEMGVIVDRFLSGTRGASS